MPSQSEERQVTDRDFRPVPDPTILTTQQLMREIASLKELLVSRLDAMDKAVTLLNDGASRSPTINEVYLQHEEKLSSIHQHFEERDKRFEQAAVVHSTAISAAMKAAGEAQIAVTEKTKHLEELHSEKFRSIQVQFMERDTRTEQTSRDAKVAVDAALQAAKEAVGEQNKSSALAIAKSEASTAKQIDQIQVVINSNTKGTDDKIDDLKTRLTTIEGRSAGVGSTWGVLLGAIGMIVGIAGMIAGVISVVILLSKSH